MLLLWWGQKRSHFFLGFIIVVCCFYSPEHVFAWGLKRLAIIEDFFRKKIHMSSSFFESFCQDKIFSELQCDLCGTNLIFAPMNCFLFEYGYNNILLFQYFHGLANVLTPFALPVACQLKTSFF